MHDQQLFAQFYAAAVAGILAGPNYTSKPEKEGFDRAVEMLELYRQKFPPTEILDDAGVPMFPPKISRPGQFDQNAEIVIASVPEPGSLESVFEHGHAFAAFHNPSRENWYILGVNRSTGKACAAGYPPSIGNLSDFSNWTRRGALTPDEVNARNRKFGDDWD